MMPSRYEPAQIRVLWAAGVRPWLEQIQSEALGLSCTLISGPHVAVPSTGLSTEVIEAISSAHLVVVVTDAGKFAYADAIRSACAASGWYAPIHVELSNKASNVEASSSAIRALAAILAPEGLVGIDMEDLRMALAHNGVTRFAVANAAGPTAAHDALTAVWNELRNAAPLSDAPLGLIVIFASSSASLSFKDAGAAITQLQPAISQEVACAYSLLNDDSLGNQWQVIAFASYQSDGALTPAHP